MKLSLVVDMYGCPNRCKHCWLGHMQNKKMKEESDLFIVNYFKPYFDQIAYYSWVREPDFCEHYTERWARDNDISVNAQPLRFELASFYRLVRDKNYVGFLKETGTKAVQLTFFGLGKMTDKYTGRKGAFEELLNATQILVENKISPRWQAFINEENKQEVAALLPLIKNLRLEERCLEFGGSFKFFVHAGSCDGENYKLYHLRINKDNIPAQLIPYYLDYEKTATEQELCAKIKNDNSNLEFEKSGDTVLNISNRFDVYFNYANMSEKWTLGNMLTLSPSQMMENIKTRNVFAINVSKEITISHLVEKYGDTSSQKIFFKEDYKFYLLLRHLDALS